MSRTHAADPGVHLRRTFNFFDVRSKTLPHEAKQLLDSAVCVTHVPPHARSARDTLLLGLADGSIVVLDAQTFEEVAQWHAHGTEDAPGRTNAIRVATDNGMIVSVGDEPSFRFPCLRVWSWPTKNASMLAHARVQHGSNPSPVSVLEVHPSLSFIAVGLQDGKVLIMRDVADTLGPGEQSSSLLRLKVVRDATNIEDTEHPDTVTGLVFSYGPETHKGRPLYLLIATVSRTLRYTVLGSGTGGSLVVLDDTGCAPRCACSFVACERPPEMHSDAPPARGAADFARFASEHMSQRLVLAHEEALYVVGPNGRVASIALEGRKQEIHNFHGQVVVISEGAQVTIFDLDTNVVTYTGMLPHAQALWTICNDEGDSVCIVGDDVTELTERPLSARLDQLLRKDHYLVAVQVAYASAARFPEMRLPAIPPGALILPRRPSESIVPPLDALIGDIYRRYGDHLYKKRDFEGAVSQFVKTVGIILPSYVIRKFLDAQRLVYLATYLQALHDLGHANADHTTLLLNCYTKLQDTEALDRFIRAPVAGTDAAAKKKSLPFDLETAISVCRRGGFFKHAAYLAETYKHHEEYLSIQLRDENNAAAAIAYLGALPLAEAEVYVQKYTGILLDGDIDGATDLLIRLYTHKEPARMDTNGSVSLEYPSPAPLFPHFVRHPRAFCRFLEAVAAERRKEPQSADDTVINDTLIELYLGLQQYDKAQHILENPKDYPYTVSHALTLCSTEGYTDGLICVYEKLQMVDEIVQYWIDQALMTGCDNDSSKSAHASCSVMDVLSRYGNEYPHLYITVLQFLTLRSDILARHEKEFHKVLTHIHSFGLLSPLQVMELVGKTDTVSVGHIADYLRTVFETEKAETEEIDVLITSYRTETKKKSSEYEQLTSETVPRVFQNQRCAICSNTLDLPRVHFMCKHSFHLRCLGDGEEGRECPICARAHEVVREIQQGNAMLSDYDFVLSELHTSGDGFEGIANLLGKGLFNHTSAHVP
ncbi:Vacuolar protein sorting-associated protein 11 [Malassezia cuniculi]|uniref:E3 ubiquitin-protein ligase PEP5 n=1 Tax=Malassezia cuniculi TaxID=948313 RepID=A0AAF0ENT1_9BASI|nr:Vacuolar protein sorting-associated protein 11 [Malassezia cuniculi]